jgi:hypothetical protein
MLRDAFDYATYWSLLSGIAATHRILRFADVGEGEPDAPFCILRHDVDYSPAAALRLAEQEAARGIRATYFLLAGTNYYNLLAPEHAHFAWELAKLGHEVGLHYDVRSFLPFPRERSRRSRCISRHCTVTIPFAIRTSASSTPTTTASRAR